MLETLILERYLTKDAMSIETNLYEACRVPQVACFVEPVRIAEQAVNGAHAAAQGCRGERGGRSAEGQEKEGQVHGWGCWRGGDGKEGQQKGQKAEVELVGALRLLFSHIGTPLNPGAKKFGVEIPQLIN